MNSILSQSINKLWEWNKVFSGSTVSEMCFLYSLSQDTREGCASQQNIDQDRGTQGQKSRWPRQKISEGDPENDGERRSKGQLCYA